MVGPSGFEPPTSTMSRVTGLTTTPQDSKNNIAIRQADIAYLSGFAAGLSDQDIEDLSEYFSKQDGLKVLPMK